MSANSLVLLNQLLGQAKAGVAPEVTDDEFFEIFAVSEILKDRGLSPDQIVDSIVDGPADGGFDAILLFVNDDLVLEEIDTTHYKNNSLIELFLFQITLSGKFQERKLQSWNSAASVLFDFTRSSDELLANYAPRVVEAFGWFRHVYTSLFSKHPRLCVNFLYVAKADQPSAGLEAQAEILKATCRGLLPQATVDVRFYGAEEILVVSQQRPAQTIELSLAEGAIVTDADSYVCLTTLTDYKRFISREDGSLNKTIFDANVRDYQGAVEVNTAIRKTLSENRRDDFWWLNNGVTILADRVTPGAR
jgi:hypothetical protein